jgi:hypothetical protein
MSPDEAWDEDRLTNILSLAMWLFSENRLVVGQSTVCKNVRTEAEDILEIRHQATTGEDIADRDDFAHAVVNWQEYKLATALHLLAMFNKSYCQFKHNL